MYTISIHPHLVAQSERADARQAVDTPGRPGLAWPDDSLPGVKGEFKVIRALA